MTNEPVGKIEDSALTAAVEAMESLIARQDWAGASRYVTHDVLYKVAHRPAATGIDGIREYMAWQYSLVHWDGHDVRMKFSRGNTVVIEVDSHFTRLADEAKLVVPCTDIYTFDGERIADWRVYADTSVFQLQPREH